MYAQTNYPNVPQGIPPTNYTIAQIGCFITSFCNLEERFGKRVDPPTINAFFRDHNLYVDIDDGCRDDVSWDFVTKYDPNTKVTGLGGATTPPHNNCIVKFIYNGGRSTHFCLVADAKAGTIIDSWDGKVKPWSVYGGVKAWASYANNSKGGSSNMATATQIAESRLENEKKIAAAVGWGGNPDDVASIIEKIDRFKRIANTRETNLRQICQALGFTGNVDDVTGIVKAIDQLKAGGGEGTVLKPGKYIVP